MKKLLFLGFAILVFSSCTSSSGLLGSSKPSKGSVQTAVDKVLDWTKKGGSATVSGIQDLPQENAARVDIQFNNFQYNADSVGNPISKNQASPTKPDVNSSDFYDQVYKYGTQQTDVKNYSGQGVGVLRHYNDGRWMLTEVSFSVVSLNANEEVK